MCSCSIAFKKDLFGYLEYPFLITLKIIFIDGTSCEAVTKLVIKPFGIPQTFRKMIITGKMENSLFSIHNPVGVILLTRLRLQLSHLNKHEFRHGFEDTISPMFSAMWKSKVMNTSSCVAIFILLKD